MYPCILGGTLDDPEFPLDIGLSPESEPAFVWALLGPPAVNL
jgi:hypothetical protein